MTQIECARGVVQTRSLWCVRWRDCFSPTELLRLPRGQRNQILADAAAQAEKEYRTNPDLTDFNAFGEDDLHVESSSTEAG